MPTLTINDIEVGMKFRSLSPVFQGDNIEFPADEEFTVVQVTWMPAVDSIVDGFFIQRGYQFRSGYREGRVSRHAVICCDWVGSTTGAVFGEACMEFSKGNYDARFWRMENARVRCILIWKNEFK